MTRSNKRSTRPTRKSAATAAAAAAAAAAPPAKDEVKKDEVTKEEITTSTPTVEPTPIFTATVPTAPVTPAVATGSKRRRDDDEDDNDEDAFYGRRSAKGRSKGLKAFERKDVQQPKEANDGKKGQVTPAKAPATAKEGSGKRLKFDPEIHGAALEARLLALRKDDGFEKMITPRKKADAAKPFEIGDTIKKDPSRWNLDRKIATPKSIKKKGVTLSSILAKEEKKHEQVQKEASPKPHVLNSESKEGVLEATIETPTAEPTSLTLEKRLQRLASPATSSSSPVRPRTVGSSFPASPAVKSSKPLTQPSFVLSGDAYMKKRAAEREERKKRMEEAEKLKQQQLQERFKSHIEKKAAKKDQQQGSGSSHAPATPRPPAAQSSTLFPLPTAPKASAIVTTAAATTVSEPEPVQAPADVRKTVITTTSEPSPAPISRRLTIDEVNQQLNNESALEERKMEEEAVLRLRQEAAEKGKETARLWAEQMKAKTARK